MGSGWLFYGGRNRDTSRSLKIYLLQNWQNSPVHVPCIVLSQSLPYALQGKSIWTRLCCLCLDTLLHSSDQRSPAGIYEKVRLLHTLMKKKKCIHAGNWEGDIADLLLHFSGNSWRNMLLDQYMLKSFWPRELWPIEKQFSRAPYSSYFPPMLSPTVQIRELGQLWANSEAFITAGHLSMFLFSLC